MRITEFLLANQHITKQDIMAALEQQFHLQQPLGRVAIRHQLLTMNQVFEVLRIQSERKSLGGSPETSHELFGSLAVELGFMDEEDLRTALQRQEETRPDLGEILVGMGKISADELAKQEKLLADLTMQSRR